MVIAGRNGKRKWEKRNKLVPSKFIPQTENFKGTTVSKLLHNEITPAYPALFLLILSCLCLTYSLPPNESYRVAKARVKLEQAVIIRENKHKKDV